MRVYYNHGAALPSRHVMYFTVLCNTIHGGVSLHAHPLQQTSRDVVCCATTSIQHIHLSLPLTPQFRTHILPTHSISLFHFMPLLHGIHSTNLHGGGGSYSIHHSRFFGQYTPQLQFCPSFYTSNPSSSFLLYLPSSGVNNIVLLWHYLLLTSYMRPKTVDHFRPKGLNYILLHVTPTPADSSRGYTTHRVLRHSL